MKRINWILSACFLFSTLSCDKKEDTVNKEFDLADKVLKIEEIASVAIRINEIHDEAMTYKFSDAEIERKIKEELRVLVNNGKSLYNETMNYLDNNDDMGLSEDDRAILANIDEQNLAEFSVIMSFAYNYEPIFDETNKSLEEWDIDRVMSCLGVALGINELAGIITNTAQLTTVQGTTQLLRLIGRRYLGWLGVAVGVHSFGRCMDVW